MKPEAHQRPGLRPIAFALLAAFALSVSAAQTFAAETDAAAATTAAKRSNPQRIYFATPQEGFDALVAALRKNDDKEVGRLLGPGHAAIVDSGDAAADRDAAAQFVAAYDARHIVQMDGEAKARIATGETEWPMPVPMVKSDAGWSFDAKAGEQELLARRIGRNELDTIESCRAFIDMQDEYAEVDRNGDGLLEYADRIVSSPGKHDGLYWPAREGEPQSPAGPLLADAAQGYRKGVATPYHGYYYRILTAQGKHAPDGAMSYYANGKLIGGVALIAYPAKYRNSGVKTFICSMSQLVYEKDLGPDTAAKARNIKAYDPDETWTKVD
ncbi:MAG TPA: DUF2950 domain-containing protein [Burkholderiaceae bacterium]|jgi:hypothetical protein|nr:DUF2950 domain-containing protein [Burkholderiaceae bacterium]